MAPDPVRVGPAIMHRVSLTGFASWTANRFRAPVSPFADPDGDGISLLEEYTLTWSWTWADTASKTLRSYHVQQPDGRRILTWQDPGKPGVAMELETSTDLIHWTSASRTP